MTDYERIEIRRFHLAVLTEGLLPDILVREPRLHHVGDRIAQFKPVWSVFTYGQRLAAAVRLDRRVTDQAPPAPVREQPKRRSIGG